MMLTGAAQARLRDMIPQGLVAQVDLAITDEYPMARAFVVISAVQGEVGLTSAGFAADAVELIARWPSRG